MSIQESINAVIGSASTVASKVGGIRKNVTPTSTPAKSRTQQFSNFNPYASEMARASLKRELEGRKAQKKRINERIREV